MPGDFEKDMKQQGDEFRLQPREWVWTAVEAELDKEKRRRFAFWWWMTPLGLLLAGAGIYLLLPSNLGNNNQQQTQNVKTVTPGEHEIATQQSSIDEAAVTTPSAVTPGDDQNKASTSLNQRAEPSAEETASTTSD